MVYSGVGKEGKDKIVAEVLEVLPSAEMIIYWS